MAIHDLMIENDYELLVDNMPGIAFVADKIGIILALNERFARVLGKPKDKLIGTLGFDHLETVVAESRFKILQTVLKTKKPVQFEDFERNKWWNTNVIPIIDKNGEVQKVIGIIQDITINKLDEKEKIDRKINYYSSLIDHAHDLIVIFDRNGKIIYENPAIDRCLGYKPNERIGKSVTDLLVPEDQASLKGFFNRLLKSKKKIYKKIIRVKHKNGSIIHFEAIFQNLLDVEEINGFVVNARDISETKRNIDLLKASEEKYHTIYDRITEGIIITNSQGIITDINPATLKILGYSKKEELVGKQTSTIYSDINQRKEVMDIILKNGFVTSHKLILSKKDGLIIHTIGSATLIRNESGKPEKIIGVFNDITEFEKNRLKLSEKMRYLDNIINNTNEIIFAIDKKNKITLWNKPTESFTGYKRWKVINKDISTIDFIINKKDFLDYVEYAFNEKYCYFDQLEIKTGMNENKLLKISPSILKNEAGDITDIVFVCNDITIQGSSQGELISRNSYFIDDDNGEILYRIFINLIHQGKKGLFLTRNYDEKKHLIKVSKNIKVMNLTSIRDKNKSTLSTLKDLQNCIKDFISTFDNSIIIIDRIDFFLNRYSYSEFMNCMYDINDVIKQHDSMLFIKINKNILNDEQYSLLIEEFNSIPSTKINNIFLDKSLLEILEFVYIENKKHHVVSQGKICKSFIISKLTAKKRINSLIDKGLIYSRNVGRSKHLFLASKGKELIEKSKIK